MFFFGIASNIVALIVLSIFSLSMLYYGIQEKAVQKFESIFNKNHEKHVSIEKSSIHYHDILAKDQNKTKDIIKSDYLINDLSFFNLDKIPILYNNRLLCGFAKTINSRGPPC